MTVHQLRPKARQKRGWWQAAPAPQSDGGATIARAAASLTYLQMLDFARNDPDGWARLVSPDRFSSFADYLKAVMGARHGPSDDRLVRAPKGAGEADPATGGFLLPEKWAADIIGSIYENAVLAPLTDLTEIANPAGSYKIPAIDEGSRADGSRWGGVFAAWAAESAQLSPSRPTWRMVEMKSNKLLAGIWLTDELLADAPMLLAHCRRVLKSEFGFLLDKAIFSGTGAGIPLGLLNCPAKIAVAKEVGQAAGTIVRENISNMWSRLPVPCRSRAVWLVHETAETQLDALAVSGGATGTMGPAMYVPAGAAGNQTALLKGRPVICLEQSNQLGSEGDVVLTDLSQYITIQAPPAFALSMDFGFDQAQNMIRASLRVDGKPAWASPITPYSGSTTRSPIISLAAR